MSNRKKQSEYQAKYDAENMKQYSVKYPIEIYREVEKGLRHSEVGMATVLEIVTNFSAALFLGCVFYFDGFLFPSPFFPHV